MDHFGTDLKKKNKHKQINKTTVLPKQQKLFYREWCSLQTLNFSLDSGILNPVIW